MSLFSTFVNLAIHRCHFDLGAAVIGLSLARLVASEELADVLLSSSKCVEVSSEGEPWVFSISGEFIFVSFEARWFGVEYIRSVNGRLVRDRWASK